MLAGPGTALLPGGTAPARAADPCAELKLSGATVLALPCPEELGRLLDSPLLKPPPGDTDTPEIDPEMAVEPDWPHDEALVAGHDWPHDRAMVVPRGERRKEAPPPLDELLGLFGRFLSRDPGERPHLEPHPYRAGYAIPPDR